MIKDKQFSRLDYAFSRFLAQLSGLTSEQKNKLEQILLDLSYAQNHGHSCITVNSEEHSLLLASKIANEQGNRPLVLENHKLYLQRYWHYECQLTTKIQQLIQIPITKYSLESLMLQYFPESITLDDIDWQKEAAIAAVKSPFTIITGGPGTGKTTTVVKILALLQELSPTPLNIALSAPTGKAAMRLQESIGQSKQGLPSTEEIKALIPEHVVTLHRLLGARPPSPYFKYNAQTLLPHDVIVIDEVSMIDLPLMSKLVNALKPNARLILLGDKDQLASVETGTVLADLSKGLPQYTQALKKSYRFMGQIKVFAEAVNAQDGEGAWQILSENHSDVCLLKSDPIPYIIEQLSDYLQCVAHQADFTHIYTTFNQFQVLCATRRRLYGVEDINERVTQALKTQNLIHSQSEWYSGRPILITQNDATLQLYNGDIGICLIDPESNYKLRVFFLLADGSIRKYLPARLPSYETVFAMTIHKSQGSEFNEVLLLLPEVINPILTKELIYTGITRAKKSVKLVTSRPIFLETLRCKVSRSSGLAQRFWHERAE